MMKRIALFTGLALLAMIAAVGQDATFGEVNGKVEYQKPGATDWIPAKAGNQVSRGTVISTGFKSTALLKIGAATITVKPITRLTLEEIIKTEGGTQTKLFLLSGRVKADVPPQPGQTTDFKVTSPTATASVRGTAFEFDGVNLIVDRGSVRLVTPTLQFRYVSAGEFSTVTTGGVVPPPAAVVVASGLERVDELVHQQQEQSLTKTEPTSRSDSTVYVSGVSIGVE